MGNSTERLVKVLAVLKKIFKSFTEIKVSLLVQSKLVIIIICLIIP